MSAFKRGRQPKMTTQALLDLDLDESSSDSDFRIEDHNASDDGSDVSKEDLDESSDDDDDSGDEEAADDSEDSPTLLLEEAFEPNVNAVRNVLEQINNKEIKQPKGPTKPICCVCLGDRSDDSNEIIECDSCQVTVHEGCYGVSDTGSISSTNSTCSTSPWFCEACRAGIKEPYCELCPNKGGIFKETDVGKWVHLVCALYVPGVAFGEVDQLSSVTLFEMPYTKWGAKICSLCENARFARTGVCIGCDAGMCKTYFHVTCGQAAGFLTEAHHDTHEADAADPFYAHCKVHSDKEIMKKRKRNFHTFHLNMQQKQKEMLVSKLDDPSPAQLRIQRKLFKSQRKYAQNKELKITPWVPTQKMSRLLTTSASACRRLLAKAAIMAVDVELLERQEAQIAALTDIRKKWHIAPAFSVEFIGYYLDRISRTKELKQQLTEMVENNSSLSKEQDSLRKDYDARLETNKELKSKQESLTSAIAQLQKQITALCPSKTMPSPSSIGRAETVETSKTATPPSRPISVPTAAALKMGVGFPLAHLGPPGTKVDSTRLLSTQAKSSPNAKQTISPIALPTAVTVSAPTTPTLGVHNFSCGICKGCKDQHLLVKCDTCKFHYHLGCLNPPLTRPPKKSKLYGWQCSECDKSDDSDQPMPMPQGPRKSRTRFNKDGLIVPVEDEKPETTPKRRSTDSAVAMTNASVKKPRLSESDSSTITKSKPKSESTTKQMVTSPISLKNEKVRGALSSPSKPIKADLSGDDCVVLVLPAAPAKTPVTVEAGDPLALTALALEDARQARKQKRKDKHKNKHNLSSDTERSSNKEHKRKHKKKFHNKDMQEMEHTNPNESGSTASSKHQIKIKLKAPSKPGEVTPEVQFLYVSADMVRSAGEASRPTSVETVEDVTMTPKTAEELPSSHLKTSKTADISHNAQPVRRLSSPRKAAQKHNFIRQPRTLISGSAASATAGNLLCCVCQQGGVTQNTVTCDECRKNYHFTCLDPPLKKTPKIRGYSWHCADCDPTDDELK